MIYIIYVFIFIFGLLIGSFLSCFIWRLMNKISLSPFSKEGKRSVCPKCGKQIAWYDNIPLLSFAMLKGRCRHCKGLISVQYPIIELITGLLFVLAWQIESGVINYELMLILNPIIHNSKFIIQIFRDWFLISVMIVIFVIDLRWYLILDVITLPAAAIIFVVNLFLGFSWQNLFISGIIGGSFFLFQFLISNGKWIGGGDIRLGLLMGFALGWPDVLTALFLAYFIGAIIGVALIAGGKKAWGSKVPMGVFLSASTLIIMFWGDRILGWYLNLF